MSGKNNDLVRCHGELKNESRCKNKTSESYCKEHSDQANEKNIVVKRVKKYLKQCEDTKTTEEKIEVVRKLYMYLMDNPIFILNHPSVRENALGKLNEFKKDWSEAECFKKALINILKKCKKKS